MLISNYSKDYSKIAINDSLENLETVYTADQNVQITDIVSNEYYVAWFEFHETTKKTKINQLKVYDRKTKEIDANFTLGWKLEVTNKIRELSFPLKLSNSEIIKIVFKGENQPIAKKNAVIFDGIIQENSGIAEYLISGNTDKYSNAQEVIDDLVNLNSYDAGDIYLAFTANNFRYNANKADGARALVIAVEWSIKNNRLYPTIIFDEPLTYEGERNMMPILKECLVQLGINKF